MQCFSKYKSLKTWEQWKNNLKYFLNGNKAISSRNANKDPTHIEKNEDLKLEKK